MADKQAVNLRIVSMAGGQTTRQQTFGDVYFKGEHLYIRYLENESELGRTTTVIKISKGRIRVLRQGAIVSEQSFAEGERLGGFYETPHGRLELMTVTDRLDVRLEGGYGTLRWSYALFAGEEEAGTFELQVDVAPAG